MKKQLLFKITLCSLLWIIATLPALSQNYEASKTLVKSSNVSSDIRINMTNHSGDIKFVTTNAQEVTINTTIHVSARSESEVNKLIKAVEDLEFELKGNVLVINTRFYKNLQSINRRTTVTLLNGEKVRIKEFKIKHELEIPESANLDLRNKYSDVLLENMTGKVRLDLYSSKFRAKDLSNLTDIKSKYSKLQIENLSQKTTIDFYDSDLLFKSAEDMEITSKYSKFQGNKAGSLVVNSYDDKLFIDDFSNLKLNAKYTDIESDAGLNQLELELYDCNLSVKSAKQGKFNGKYCDLNLGDIEYLKVDDSYDNNISAGRTNKIEFGKSKYSKYILDSNSGFVIADSYDDDIEIGQLNEDFSGLSVMGKYGSIDINAGNVPYQLDLKLKYPKTDLPESIKIIKQVEKSGELELLANDKGGKIKVEGYDMKVVIED